MGMVFLLPMFVANPRERLAIRYYDVSFGVISALGLVALTPGDGRSVTIAVDSYGPVTDTPRTRFTNYP